MTKGDDSVHYFWTKSEADTFKHKYNGLSTTVEYMKVAIAGLSVGATVAKFDFSLLKVDEKGIVIGGVQKYTWPHARDAKGKAEAAEKKLTRLSDRADSANARAKQALDDVTRLSARVNAANSRTGNAAAANSSPAVQSQLARAQLAQKDSEKASKKAQEAYVKTVQLARKAEKEKTDAEQASRSAATSYRNIRNGFVDTRRQLRLLESELA